MGLSHQWVCWTHNGGLVVVSQDVDEVCDGEHSCTRQPERNTHAHTHVHTPRTPHTPCTTHTTHTMYHTHIHTHARTMYHTHIHTHARTDNAHQQTPALLRPTVGRNESLHTTQRAATAQSSVGGCGWPGADCYTTAPSNHCPKWPPPRYQSC